MNRPCAEVSRRLRVVVLSRTGANSGQSFAECIEQGPHELCGLLCEHRIAMRLRRLLRAVSRDWRSAVALLRGGISAGSSRSETRRRGCHHKSQKLAVTWNLNGPGALRTIRAWRPDVLIVANAPILKRPVCQAAPVSMNFHSGRLPEYGGVDSEFWMLWDGLEHGWVTWHQLTATLDSGAILAEEKVPAPPGVSPSELHTLNVEAGGQLLSRLLDEIARDSFRPVREPGRARLRRTPTLAERQALGARRQATMR